MTQLAAQPMTVQQLAQAMLDRYGFFVVIASQPEPLGTSKLIDDQGRLHLLGSIPKGTAVITGPATYKDYCLQCALIGINPDSGEDGYLYRAVAE